MKNSIFVIKPYKWLNMWVFDDHDLDLVREPFVSGTDTMIDVATSHIPNAERGFIAVFSGGYFPDAQIVLEWAKKDGEEFRVKSLDGTQASALAFGESLVHGSLLTGA